MTRARDLASMLHSDGSLNITTSVNLGDNEKAYFGDANDLVIFHNASKSIIEDVGTGNLEVRGTNIEFLDGTGTEYYLTMANNGSVGLYWDGNLKLSTTSTGVAVTGSVTADYFKPASNQTDPNDGTAYIYQQSGIGWDFAALNLKFSTGASGNRAERMRIDSSGNVGIGAVPSGQRLLLADTSANAVNIQLQNNTASNFFIGADTTNLVFYNGGSERVRIDSSGNVGIGAVPETTYVQKTTLRLSATASLIAGTSYYPFPYYVANNLNYDASDNLKYIANSGGALLSVNAHTGGSFSFYTAPAGTAGATASITERLRIDSSGRVTMPSQPAFHAHGTTAAWTVFSNGGWTQLVLPATSLNIGNHYNTASSAFTAPVAGVYHFYYKVYGRVQSGAPASTYWQSRFQKNNNAINSNSAMIMAYYYNDGGKDETATYSMNISLAVNDYITLHAQSAGAYNGEYYPVNCEFGGYLIG